MKEWQPVEDVDNWHVKEIGVVGEFGQEGEDWMGWTVFLSKIQRCNHSTNGQRENRSEDGSVDRIVYGISSIWVPVLGKDCVDCGDGNEETRTEGDL